MIRPLIALVLLLGLTACGFHLRNRLTLPPGTPAVKVESTSRYSELVKLVKRGLIASKVTVADDDATEGVALLKIDAERWGTRAIAIDAEGRAQEYELRYAVIFTFYTADGQVLVPQQVIESSRDYVSQATDNTGTQNEKDILADEMRSDMASSIMRRIDSVVRAKVEKGEASPLGNDSQEPAADGTSDPAAPAVTTSPATDSLPQPPLN